MSRPIRTTLAATAALVIALVALPARADHDEGRRGRGPGASISIHAAPAAPPAFVVSAPWRPAHWDRGWRARELRHEYRELAAARDRFYATWDGRPWARGRFESWYASRRAALDARRADLARWSR